MTLGLGIFRFVFAVISSLHSYLILAYASSEKAAEDVGFYDAANAEAGSAFSFRECSPNPAVLRLVLGDRRRCWRSALS